jgi:thiol peroxidase
MNLKVLVNGEEITLGKKERKTGSEAPAVRIRMLNGETKVIGMMSNKVQAMFTLPFSHSINDELNTIIHKYRDRANIYLISSDEFAYDVNKNYASMDFKNFSLKFGVNVDESTCAKSVFIINKDGEITYRSVLKDLITDFDIAEFDKALNETIKFKKKGHTHENWMSA